MSEMNKALDLNKLFGEQKKGKQLNKTLSFPLYAGIKYDGNYVTIIVDTHGIRFITSGGLEYTHSDNAGDIFKGLPEGVYLAERKFELGLLGQRNKCNLRGTKANQISRGHSYRVFDVLTLDDYNRGVSNEPYNIRRQRIYARFDQSYIATEKLVYSKEELDEFLHEVVKLGYEGLVGKDPKWKWEAHKTRRKINFFKYKKRPTVDLLCVGIKEGKDKYEGLIGSLVLRDKLGREVSTGSGMSDADRVRDPSFFVGKVVEVFYEQIMDTYIQPTFGAEYEGVLVRVDKTAEEID